MRIQHNILAMNAYRNYNANTKSLAGNLEKLSSGYKINRAGDDAAGLAISEKMRAQITGLSAAQKNVKDGISLVKTAEGAMQEIQDMLNRMDYLATQSANGTYDNEVDRANLQKEVDQLKTEINRIADSANFNGIKLLDGSLDKNADLSAKADFTVGKDLPGVGQTLGKDTVLHNEANGDNGTQFSVDLHNFKFDATKGSSMTLKVGGTSITLTATDDLGELSSADVVGAIVNGKNGINVTVGEKGDAFDASDLSISGQKFTVTGSGSRLTFTQDKPPKDAAEEVNGSMEVSVSGDVKASIAEYSFDSSTLATGTPAKNGVLTIGSQKYTFDGTATFDNALEAMSQMSDVSGFKVSLDGTTVSLTATTAGAKDAPTISFKAAQAGTGTLGAAATTGVDGVASTGDTATQVTDNTGTLSVAGETVVAAGDFTGTAISGTTSDGKYKWSVATDGTATITAAETGTAGDGTVAVAVDGTDATVTLAGGVDEAKTSYIIDTSDWKQGDPDEIDVAGTKISLTQAAGADGAALGTTGYTAKLGNDGKLTITADTAGAAGSDGPAALTGTVEYFTFDDANSKTLAKDDITTVTAGVDGDDLSKITQGSNGDWNVSTTNINNVTAEGVDRLASTSFDLTAGMATEGSKLKVGDTTYTFTSDKKLIGKAGYVDISSGDLDKIAKNLTEAAADDPLYTIGHDGSRITLTETEAHAKLDASGYDEDEKWDLSTAEGIAKSLGFTAGGSRSGSALTLQIGDTSESFNQMKVEIGDMHTSAMGTAGGASIADVDISTQEGAAAAVQTVKDAINYVSSVRGDLGAIQNRLEHTGNNLSVMAENIQDAESTIRDTDVAEEMMSYVKNNILVQSAQAMLAQANQVPQGVLQLLG